MKNISLYDYIKNIKTSQIYEVIKKNINIQDLNGYTFLMLASKNGKKDIIEFFIKLGADIDLVNNNNETAVLIASKFSNYEIVELLLEKGADLTITNYDFSCS